MVSGRFIHVGKGPKGSKQARLGGMDGWMATCILTVQIAYFDAVEWSKAVVRDSAWTLQPVDDLLLAG
jgi:hypothetical protein